MNSICCRTLPGSGWVDGGAEQCKSYPKGALIMNSNTATVDQERSTTPTVERVLIVEDDGATRSGLTELVRTWGFLAEAAADGEEGLEKVSSFRPSIVVSDLVMPRRTGLELLEALRDIDPSIAVILLTAQGTVESAVEAIRSGFVSCSRRRPNGNRRSGK